MPKSSSESSDDEEFSKLKDAVDPEFQNHFSVKVTEAATGPTNNGVRRESKRKVISTEWEAGHFVHPLKLTPATQDFVAKQLAMVLEKKIKEVETNLLPHPDEDGGILLFQDSTRRLRGKDIARADRPKRKRSKASRVQKRPESGRSSSEDDDDKLRSVAVSADWVLNPGTV